MKETQKQNYTVDANGMVLGRLCSEVAKMLMGKNEPEYERHLTSGNKVTVLNASKLKMTEKRKKETLHETYSGYPGGLKFRSNDQIIDKKGYSELIRLAVYGMLPNNRLRALMMKNLTIKE